MGVLHKFTDSVIREKKEAYTEEAEVDGEELGIKKRMPFLGNYITISNVELFKYVKSFFYKSLKPPLVF